MSKLHSLPERYRKQAIDSLFSINTFKESWKVWHPEIQRILGPNYDADDLLRLGNHLSDIFRKTGTEGRDQSELSAGGTAWEALVCWYVNLCTAGSRTVAFKQMRLVPQAVQDAITINYGNFACNTESDITVVVFPDLPAYTEPVAETMRGNWKQLSEYGNQLVTNDFQDLEIGIIQCKTNWNDNAQIPMLWDMMYAMKGYRDHRISIGRNGFTPKDCKRFTYSFVVAPLAPSSDYTIEKLCVKQVAHLSGGNYWGLPSKDGVAKSLGEICVNYSAGFNRSMREGWVSGGFEFVLEK
jgi:hypothetical protein